MHSLLTTMWKRSLAPYAVSSAGERDMSERREVSEQAMLMYPDEYRVMFEIEDDYWWYRGLRKLIRALLAQYAPESSSRPMILDVGCGTGANLKLLQSYGNAIGIDISEQALGFCR